MDVNKWTCRSGLRAVWREGSNVHALLVAVESEEQPAVRDAPKPRGPGEARWRRPGASLSIGLQREWCLFGSRLVGKGSFALHCLVICCNAFESQGSRIPPQGQQQKPGRQKLTGLMAAASLSMNTVELSAHACSSAVASFLTHT